MNRAAAVCPQPAPGAACARPCCEAFRSPGVNPRTPHAGDQPGYATLASRTIQRWRNTAEMANPSCVRDSHSGPSGGSSRSEVDHQQRHGALAHAAVAGGRLFPEQAGSEWRPWGQARAPPTHPLDARGAVDAELSISPQWAGRNAELVTNSAGRRQCIPHAPTRDVMMGRLWVEAPKRPSWWIWPGC